MRSSEIVTIERKETIMPTQRKTKVLFVCIHNSARSQMAEAFLNQIAGDDFDAHERCPVFPGVTRRIHWSFADPAAIDGEWEHRLAATRLIRDEIRSSVISFIS
jgi:arsenate reductase